MEEKERQLHREDIADLYIGHAERFEHSAIFMHHNPGDARGGPAHRRPDPRAVRRPLLPDAPRRRHLQHPRRRGHGRILLPHGRRAARSCRPRRSDGRRRRAPRRGDGASTAGWTASPCAPTTASNQGPFLAPRCSPSSSRPTSSRLTQAYRDMGFYVIKHTDGNIMPILDQLVQSAPARAALARPAGRRGHRRGQAPATATRCA